MIMTNNKVGVQRRVYKDDPVDAYELSDVLHAIEFNESIKRKTQAVRGAKSKEEKTKLKMELTALFVSTASPSRLLEDNDSHTGWLMIDVDKFGGEDNPDKTLEEGIAIVEDLMKDYAYVIGYFVSPSGNGLKVLTAIEPDVTTHVLSFVAMRDLFNAHGLGG